MGYSRRAFLSRIGATAAGTAVALVLLPPPAPPQRSERPVDPHDGALPEITDERVGPFALWQYRRGVGGYEPTSPINVVAPLAGSDRSLDDVLAVLRDAGWVERPAEYVRFAFDAQHETFERQHASAAQTFHGGFGRHHVRAWAFEGQVSIQAHEDTAPTPEHEVASYESTRHLLEWLFHEAGWAVTPDGVRFANETGPDHAGLVTVIEP